MEKNPKDYPVELRIPLSGEAMEMLRLLFDTGLYGNSLPEVAERLVCAKLIEEFRLEGHTLMPKRRRLKN